MPDIVEQSYDYLIIGAGISGLYAAHRLHSAFPGKRIAIVEASGREGGRMLTLSSESDPESPYELGAMRFGRNHILVSSMLNYFGIQTKNFSHSHHSMHVRGRSVIYRDGDLDLRGSSPGFGDLYHLNYDERLRDPASLVKLALYKILIDILSLSDGLSEFSQNYINNVIEIGPDSCWPYLPPHIARDIKLNSFVQGKELHSIAFCHLLQHYTSPEAYHFIRDGLGYYTITSEWNAADAACRFINEIGAQPSYHSPLRGVHELVSAVVHDIQDHVDISYYTNAVHIRRDLDGLIVDTKTSDADDSEALYGLGTDGDNGTRNSQSIHAKHVLVCVPAGAAEHISVDNDVLAESYRKPRWWYTNVTSVSAHPLLKIVLCYEEPWWEKHLGTDVPTRITTDTSIRQIFFNRPTDEKPNVLPHIMYYADGTAAQMWSAVRLGTSAGESLPNPPGTDPTMRLKVPRRLETKLNRQIAYVFGLHPRSIPHAIGGAMKSWSQWPNTGGWTAWKAAAASPEVREALSDCGYQTGRLAVCGESYAAVQGWVEGALQSVEKTLDKWGIPKPEWVKQDQLQEVKCNNYADYIH